MPRMTSESSGSEAREWILSIAIAVALAFIIKAFLFDFVLVQGTSMVPTLLDGERLIINKIGYRVTEPDYGDIVVLKHADNVDYVKRVIGKEGDQVEIKNRVVYRNGQALDEPYINSGDYDDFAKVTVPKGTYFVLGDNRPISLDSRYDSVGFIKRADIIGKVIFRFWPFSRLGTVQ